MITCRSINLLKVDMKSLNPVSLEHSQVHELQTKTKKFVCDSRMSGFEEVMNPSNVRVQDFRILSMHQVKHSVQ